jgi:peptide/nickel transport system ATP-binding protein
MPQCRDHFPARTDLGGGHWTHCFLYGDGEAQAPIIVTKTPAKTKVETQNGFETLTEKKQENA